MNIVFRQLALFSVSEIVGEFASPRSRDLPHVPQWTATGWPVLERLAKALESQIVGSFVVPAPPEAKSVRVKKVGWRKLSSFGHGHRRRSNSLSRSTCLSPNVTAHWIDADTMKLQRRNLMAGMVKGIAFIERPR
jgi:hypothetical protein